LSPSHLPAPPDAPGHVDERRKNKRPRTRDATPGDGTRSTPRPPALRGPHATDTAPRPPWLAAVGWLLAVLVVLVVLSQIDTTGGATQLDYSEFLTKVDAGEVTSASIDPDGRITGKLATDEEYRTQVPTAIVGDELSARLEAKGVDITGKGPSTSWSTWVLTFAPIVVLIGLFVWMGRRTGRGGGLGLMSRAKTQVIDQQRPDVRFADVAGYEGVKEELAEIIEFLRNPDRFSRLGAKGPKGVLMLGPPGTGKTLFARAIAGEADVPFLSVTGSTFVEMFVGVGAARVRDLFDNARKLAPSIVFIDEIDAVGQRRGANAMLGNDEREQTLNQLLAEMDGFGSGEGVVVLAATNRPDVLDPALLRPGRFDRHVTIPLPNRDERHAILAVHCRSKPLATNVDLDEIARGTPGFSGADLANLANEAAIAAVRANRDALVRDDFFEARDRIMLGRRDRSSILLPDEKVTVAAHEAGHALVATMVPGADPVSKVTILPSGPALGATEQLPIDERHLYSESHLLSSLAVRLGGRAGELVAVGEVSSGASDDLAGATELATRMVREFGMSPALGTVGYPLSRDFLGMGGATHHEFADATQRMIDSEVARIVNEARDRALAIVRAHEPQLRALIDLLLEHETVDGADVLRLCAPAATGDGATPGPAAAAPPADRPAPTH
jgi:cell division protease FtsH